MKNIFVRAPLLLCCTIVIVHAETITLNPQSSVESCFSFTHTCGASIVRLINGAKARILLAGYGFTSNDIAKAIKEAHQRGVKVQLVLDKSNITSKYSRATYLANAGVDIRINKRYAIMHHKFVIVDNIVGFGSMNFTKAGDQKNAENFNIFRNTPGLVRIYEKEFLRLYNESEKYSQTQYMQRNSPLSPQTRKRPFIQFP